MSKNLVTVLIVAIALMGGFYGGYRYESAKVPVAGAAAATPAGRTGAAGGPGGFGGAGGPGGAGGAGGGAGGAGAAFGGRGGAGTVTGLTATGFTLHSANGTDTKVTFGTGATVRKTDAGQLSDLTDNATVTVTGQRDASGNLVATVITIVPATTPTPGG